MVYWLLGTILLIIGIATGMQYLFRLYFWKKINDFTYEFLRSRC